MFLNRFAKLSSVLEACVYSTPQGTLEPEKALESAHFLLRQVEKMEGIVYVIGNGGSAGIASHFCTDLLRTLEIPAATFSDSNILTCFANDFGYENVYSMPLMRNMRRNDVLVAISSSGKSKNIVAAASVAKQRKSPVITFTGFSEDNPLRQLGDLNYWLDSRDYGLVETGHFFLLHTIVDTCKKKSNSLAKSAL